MNLVSILRDLDPWPFMAGLFAILWAVEVKFGGRARATRHQIMEARLAGYDLASRQCREAIGIRAKAELEAEEFAE